MRRHCVRADIGISVDSAVDIAKEAADIILLEKSLVVLDEGVIESRTSSVAAPLSTAPVEVCQRFKNGNCCEEVGAGTADERPAFDLCAAHRLKLPS
jgi:hypothetical protein